MIEHIFMPGISLERNSIHAAYLTFLKNWREDAIQRADNGDVAASICHQATLIELALFGSPKHDWLAIMDEFLTHDGRPQAYSEAFSKRLHSFGNQFRQSTVHAIHTRWWIETITNPASVDHERFANFVLQKKQSDGLIYDRDVSETILRHRMKSELTMSMAMSVEILGAAKMLDEQNSIEFATNLTTPTKCPLLGYMSMEYFRLKALRLLGQEALYPLSIDSHIEASAEDLDVGWCDFSMKSKIDAYMGTAKRTQRDKPIHSPLIACHVSALTDKVADLAKRTLFSKRLSDYATFLTKYPLDIPSFQMRDVPIQFGTDITPIEIICSSFLINQCKNN